MTWQMRSSRFDLENARRALPIVAASVLGPSQLAFLVVVALLREAHGGSGWPGRLLCAGAGVVASDSRHPRILPIAQLTVALPADLSDLADPPTLASAPSHRAGLNPVKPAQRSGKAGPE